MLVSSPCAATSSACCPSRSPPPGLIHRTHVHSTNTWRAPQIFHAVLHAGLPRRTSRSPHGRATLRPFRLEEIVLADHVDHRDARAHELVACDPKICCARRAVGRRRSEVEPQGSKGRYRDDCCWAHARAGGGYLSPQSVVAPHLLSLTSSGILRHPLALGLGGRRKC